MRTFDGLKRGTRIQVTGNCNGHNYEVGRIYILKVDGKGSSMSDPFMDTRGNTIESSDCRLVITTLEDLKTIRKAKIAEMEKQIEVLDFQIDYCEKHGLKELDPEVVSLAGIITAMEDNSLSLHKKAEKILQFLKI